MKQLITVFAVLFSATVFGQNVGIGTTTPDPNAQLDVSSSNKGILIPRMTLAQRNAIPGITLGLMIYQTDNNPGFYVNKSSSFAFNWVPITEGKNLWSTSLGNANYISNINTGNVGIGTTLPETKFAVTNDDSAIVLFNNSQTLANNIQSNIYVGTGRNSFGGYFTGGIRTTGTSASTARMSLLTGAATAGNNLQERVSIDNAGNMGVGTISPNYILDVNGRMRLRDKGTNLTAGIWHNKADNTEAAFIGMVNDSTYGFFGNGTSGNWKMGFDVKNAQMGIGMTDPTAPLSFTNNIGNKIALWGDANGGHYGLGIQGSLLQMYSSGSNADIAFGYGSSTSFTEQMRIKGMGNVGIGTNNPTSKLEVFGNSGEGISVNSGSQALTIKTNLFAGGMIGTTTAANINLIASNNIGATLKPDGNFGIGTTNPTTAGLVVNKIVGNTNAIFGGNSTGVSLQSSYPGVGFNTYYNGGSIMIGNGGAGYVGADPTTGRIIIASTNVNSTAGQYNGLFEKMSITNDGTVSLGSSNLGAENNSLGAGYKLKVFGKIISEEVRVQLKTAWPDYVFEKNYKKLSLNELEKYIDEHKHLPNIPSATEIEKDGQHLGEIQRKMLEKIEELSLYVIELKKEIDLLKTTTHEKK
jgi:hypothetical protein